MCNPLAPKISRPRAAIFRARCHDAIKDYQARKYGEPPFGHAETSSLKQFSAFLGLDSDLILQKMREADFKGEPKPESIFIDIATSNDMTCLLYTSPSPRD